MKKFKFRIEQSDYKIQGHSGLGRIILRGPSGRVFDRLTRRQASKIIGDSILSVYYRYNDEQQLRPKETGVQINIEITNYKLK